MWELINGALGVLSNLATIATAGVATTFFGQQLFEKRQRRLALETYLREEKFSDRDRGKRSLMHLMAHLGMTETDILHAGFSSQNIETSNGADERGRADRLLFEYVGSEAPEPGKY